MIVLLAIMSALIITDADAEALRRTAPQYLTVETARLNLVAARAAAGIVGVDADDLLSVAHHESRYTETKVQDEGTGPWWRPRDPVARWSPVRVSCGIMTPAPKPACEPWELEMAGGYLAGARHLREWIDLCRGDRLCALNGYAGGADDPQVRGYKTWQVFAARASWIKRER